MPEDPAKRGQEFFQMFQKAREFTEELLKENERLRLELARWSNMTVSLQATGTGADLASRVRELEDRLREVEARYRQAEKENQEFSRRYVDIEEQNNNLANLYVASYQLHSTLDYAEVLRIVQEIVINLIGAEQFHLFMVNEKTGQLDLELSKGPPPPVKTLAAGEGLIGTIAQTGANYFSEKAPPGHAAPFDQPLACVPLKIKDGVIGVISIHKLLAHKAAFTAMDYELFTLLAGHAATAIFSARLYSSSARKLTTLQNFLQMIKSQPAP